MLTSVPVTNLAAEVTFVGVEGSMGGFAAVNAGTASVRMLNEAFCLFGVIAAEQEQFLERCIALEQAG